MFTKATIEKQASQEGSLPKNIQLLSVTSFHLNKKKNVVLQNHYVLKPFLMDTLTIGNSPEDGRTRRLWHHAGEVTWLMDVTPLCKRTNHTGSIKLERLCENRQKEADIKREKKKRHNETGACVLKRVEKAKMD